MTKGECGAVRKWGWAVLGPASGASSPRSILAHALSLAVGPERTKRRGRLIAIATVLESCVAGGVPRFPTHPHARDDASRRAGNASSLFCHLSFSICHLSFSASLRSPVVTRCALPSRPHYNEPMSRRSSRGFSLVEVMAALLILSFVLITSLAVFVERQRRLQRADELIVVTQALVNETEVLRHEPYSSLHPGAAQPFTTTTEILGSLPSAETEVKVEQWKPGVKLVTLTVRWREGTASQSLQLVRADTGGGTFW